MNEKIDVKIWNGRIEMLTCTVSGSKANVEKIRQATQTSRFDVAGTNIKLAYSETASRFMKLFAI